MPHGFRIYARVLHAHSPLGTNQNARWLVKPLPDERLRLDDLEALGVCYFISGLIGDAYVKNESARRNLGIFHLQSRSTNIRLEHMG